MVPLNNRKAHPPVEKVVPRKILPVPPFATDVGIVNCVIGILMVVAAVVVPFILYIPSPPVVTVKPFDDHSPAGARVIIFGLLILATVADNVPPLLVVAVVVLVAVGYVIVPDVAPNVTVQGALVIVQLKVPVLVS